MTVEVSTEVWESVARWLEAVEGEYAEGEGKEVYCVTFTKDCEKHVRKGRAVSVIPAWTDERPIKPERQIYVGAC